MASFQHRFIGAIGLNAATYEDVEHDAGATIQAGLIVVIASLTTSVSWYFGLGGLEWMIPGALRALGSWFLGALVLWLIGTRVLPGRNTEADLGQLLRTIGFAQAPGVFGLLAVLPIVGPLVPFLVSMWVVAASFVAVRQALDYDSTPRAIAVCFLGWLVSALVFMLTDLATPLY